jgi:hypothetical protein
MDYSKIQVKVGNGREKSWSLCLSLLKIPNRKLDYSNKQAKVSNGRENSWSLCLSLLKIPSRKLDYSNIQAKVSNERGIIPGVFVLAYWRYLTGNLSTVTYRPRSAMGER